jgi:hypothetical protein
MRRLIRVICIAALFVFGLFASPLSAQQAGTPSGARYSLILIAHNWTSNALSLQVTTIGTFRTMEACDNAAKAAHIANQFGATHTATIIVELVCSQNQD